MLNDESKTGLDLALQMDANRHLKNT